MLPSQLLETYNQREKLIIDTYIRTKGIDVSVKAVSIDETNPYDGMFNDPLNINVQSIDYGTGTIRDFKAEEDRKVVFLNSSFQPIEISMDMFLDDKSSNINELYCYIDGTPIPKASIIKLKSPYENMQFRVEELMLKRPMSNVIRYRLTRN
ncbi:MAG: hypothetical protein ACWGHH_06490 [Sulfurovaceae bacterium]